MFLFGVIMKKIFILILSCLLPIMVFAGEEKAEVSKGLGETKTSENFDNRSDKAIIDMEGEQKKIDVTDPRNLTTDITDDSKKVQKISDESDIFPKGLGDKNGADDKIVKNNPNEDAVKDINGDKKNINVTDPRNKTTDITDDKKLVQNISSEIAEKFVNISGHFATRFVHKLTEEKNSYINQGRFHITLSKDFKNTKYKITFGSLNPNYVSSHWNDFQTGFQLGAIEANGSWYNQSTEVTIGRYLNFFDKNGYFISGDTFFDGAFVTSKISDFKISALINYINFKDEAQEKDPIFLTGLTANYEKGAINTTLSYFWLHGDGIVEKFQKDSENASDTDYLKNYQNSDMKVDNHFVSASFNYTIKFNEVESLRFFADCSYNFSMSDDNKGVSVGANYKIGNYNTKLSFQYREQDAFITPYTHPVYISDVMGGDLSLGYSFNKNSVLTLETYYYKPLTKNDAGDKPYTSATRLIYKVSF